MSHNMPTTVIYADMGALAVLVSSWAGILPSIAAFLAVFWYAIQIYDRFFGK